MALITIAIGLVFLIGGISVILHPRIQGARDADLITSDEVGSGERLGAYAGGLVLVVMGLGFIYLGV